MKKILLLIVVALNFVFISCDKDKDEPAAPPDGQNYVDLGLPSGTLWATCNVGANTPEDYGDYFAWGEIYPKDFYDCSNYKWSKSCYTMTKYCTESLYGMVDNKTELDPEDDAAYANWGPSWRMPTFEQLQELAEKCSWKWTKKHGKYGRLGTGPNGNTIFLPASGCFAGDRLQQVGSYGEYWSRTLYSDYSYYAHCLNFTSEYFWDLSDHIRDRNWGFCVRAVRVTQY